MAPKAPQANTQATNTVQHGPRGEKPKKIHKRTRTGCKTCRRRKMKCDEVKPTCGNCSKSRRDCTWPDGGIPFLGRKQIADESQGPFRHNQNPALNEETRSLGKFYRGSGTFTQEQRNNFVRVNNDCKSIARHKNTVLTITMQYNSHLPWVQSLALICSHVKLPPPRSILIIRCRPWQPLRQQSSIPHMFLLTDPILPTIKQLKLLRLHRSLKPHTILISTLYLTQPLRLTR